MEAKNNFLIKLKKVIYHEKILLEISNLENLEYIVLSGFGHVGLDYIGNLSIIIMKS